MSKFTVHECPLSDIPLAAHTLVNVMTRTNPLIAYIHNSNLPLSPIPYGKLQLITIYLFQLSTTGIILSIDDEETNEKCVGVAVWSGPLKRSIWQRIWISLKMFYLSVWMTINLLWFGNVQNVKRRDAFNSTAATLRKEILGSNSEIWHLHFVAVKPAYQGLGLGSKLIRSITETADRDGLRSYLTTSLYSPNVAIYQKLGYELKKTGVIDVDGTRFEFYCMLREPRVIRKEDEK